MFFLLTIVCIYYPGDLWGFIKNNHWGSTLCHFTMWDLQYRATVWICRRLSNDLCSDDVTCPIRLFEYMTGEGAPLSWGHYAVYITWLNRHFQDFFGSKVFRYLKKHHSKNMYSFWYLARQYYVNKIIRFLRRS